MLPSPVHPANATSPARRGSTQCAPRAYRLGTGALNGLVSRSSGASRRIRPASIASVNPVPTVPAYGLITDDDVTDAVTRYALGRPPLDPISRRALAAPPSAPSATAPAGDAEGGNDADAGQPEDPEGDPETILRTALWRAPEEGVSVPDLVAATGMSRRWVYYRLRELAAAGHVIQTARGHWRIAPAGGNRE